MVSRSDRTFFFKQSPFFFQENRKSRKNRKHNVSKVLNFKEGKIFGTIRILIFEGKQTKSMEIQRLARKTNLETSTRSP